MHDSLSSSTDGSSRILIISLGGTIASTPTPSSTGVVPQLTASDLVEAVPALRTLARIESSSFRQVPSGDLGFADMVALAHFIEDAIENGVQGVVVTQGTDTIEETSFALDLLLKVDVPVVVTGAMRHPTLASSDGPGNLVSAVLVAASRHARGIGCLVVMNEEIHAARLVRKTHSSNLAAFRSPNGGALGWIAEGRVRIFLRPARLLGIEVAASLDVPAVAIVTSALGDDGRSLDALHGLGYRGAVVDALGGGHVPSSMMASISAALAHMPVVLCSRTGSGDVLTDTYGFSGSETDLLGRGVLWGGALDARKARVALSLALATSQLRSKSEEIFASVRDAI